MDHKYTLTFSSYEALEHHLQNCTHWYSTENVGQFDTVGITTLFSALLDNLRTNIQATQHKDFKQMLSKENIAFLETILKESN